MYVIDWFKERVSLNHKERERMKGRMKEFKKDEDDQIDKLLTAAEALAKVFRNDSERPVSDRDGFSGSR